jgi:hypothetical protein
MDMILPYVVWITLLAWLMDWGLKTPDPQGLSRGTKGARGHELHHGQ